MKPRTFQTIWRPEVFIGREALLDKIQHALMEAATRGDRATVIAIRAPGGLGKTRLLEEVLLRLGHRGIADRLGLPFSPRETWSFPNVRYVPSDILDFVLPELSVRPTLLQALHNSLAHEPDMSFETFDYIRVQMRRGLQEQRGFQAFQEIQKRLEASFFQDLQQNIHSQRRPVWALDTVERLALPLESALWRDLAEALGEPLLSWDDADLVTGPWLLDRLQAGRFQGAVLLLAGRQEEGKAFWEALEAAHKASRQTFDLIWVEPDPFTLEEARQFLEHTASNIRKQPRWAQRADILDYLLQNEEYLDTFVQLTAGKPVFLSIFADVLVTAREITISIPDLSQQLRRSDAESELRESRRRLIQTFMEALLSEGRKGLAALESRILLALARSPRGLDAHQLAHLFRTEDQQVKPEDLARAMEALRRLTIVKVRPCPPGMLPEEAGTLPLEGDRAMMEVVGPRLSLQDEIYPLFARYILETAPAAVRLEEQRARRRQYEQLRAYAERRRRALQDRRTAIFQQYIQVMEIESPLQALHPRWELRPSTAEQWSWLERRLRFWELEHLHYHMLLSPTDAWNVEYLDLAETRWYSGSLEGDILLQSEVLALMQHHTLLLRFANIPEKDERQPRDLRRLRCAIRTEEVTRWLKRMILAQRFRQAMALAERIEEAIRHYLSRNEEARDIWMHPLSWGERRVWHTYARILAGERPNLKALEEILAFLEDLIHEKWQFEPHISIPKALQQIAPNGDRLLERVPGLDGHPAKERARRVLAIGYNFLGYGYVVQGEFERGRTFYRRSLHHMHYIHFPAQEAATRNNMGRALASIGDEDAGLQLVYQALRLREAMAGLLPYAYSLNTAALLNNSMGRPLRALGQAARAAAIFHQVSDYRGRGLALIEVATAARRLAKTADPGLLNTVVEDPEALLDMADRAIDEALEIFALVHCRTKDIPPSTGFASRGICEPVRLVEAQLVKSEISQDKMGFTRTFEGLRRLYQENHRLLQHALKRSDEEGWPFLAVNALVNQVETHYWYAYHIRRTLGLASVALPDLARRARDEALRRGAEDLKRTRGRIPEEAVIREPTSESDGRQPPSYRPVHAPYWKLLSKRHRFEAGLLLERFWDNHFEKVRINGHPQYRFRLREGWAEDKEALRAIARNFVKAVLYGRLFAPRTRVIRMVYRFIGRYLDELENLEFAWRQGPYHDAEAAEAVRALMNSLYDYIVQEWRAYHEADSLGRVGLEHADKAIGSIVPLPHQLASLPRWLEEVYLLSLKPNGQASGGTAP